MKKYFKKILTMFLLAALTASVPAFSYASEYNFDGIESLPSYGIGGIDGKPGTNIFYDPDISDEPGGGSVYFR